MTCSRSTIPSILMLWFFSPVVGLGVVHEVLLVLEFFSTIVGLGVVDVVFTSFFVIIKLQANMVGCVVVEFVLDGLGGISGK